MKPALALVYLVVVTPIWYYLMFKLLQSANASELMWFLFWAYVPLHFLVSAVAKLSEK
ncbi:hypothetical protein [Methylibium sp.]|uniref:hypothetical protein n=1 Tax=Methylibium sp. TaxID=2067992 RepID=UPI003D0F8C93